MDTSIFFDNSSFHGFCCLKVTLARNPVQWYLQLYSSASQWRNILEDLRPCALLPGVTVSPAAERLRYILSEDDDLPTPTLFTEMDTLQREGDELEWKESARWVTPTLSHTTNEQQLYLAQVEKNIFVFFNILLSVMT